MINQLLFLHQLAVLRLRYAQTEYERGEARASVDRRAARIDAWRISAGLPLHPRPAEYPVRTSINGGG